MTSAQDIGSQDKAQKRQWIYALKPKGKLYNYRKYLSYVYLITFFALPFIKIDGDPLFQFDFLNGEFTFFGVLFTPQDFVIFGIGMLIFIFFIIVFTLVYGRVFCGWICPQTIFMEMVFRRIEYWIEGDANRQKINDGKKWNREIYVRKTIKHILFLAISFLIANTFLAYIIGVEALGKIIREPVSMHVGGFVAIVFFTLLFYSIYAFVRELVCTVICPYGRLQGVLMDKNSVVVAYDYLRGEPRSKKRASENIGDCIDCNMCVNVCPTGIDIRKGTQLECTNCTACIDACDMMMRKIGKPERLITFASENQIAAGKSFAITGRIKAYSVVLIALMALLTLVIITRTTFDATILRIPGQLTQNNSDGTISNMYRIKVTNKSNKDMPYKLVPRDKDITLNFVGNRLDTLKGRALSEEMFFIKIPEKKITQRRQQFKLDLVSSDKIIVTEEATFITDY